MKGELAANTAMSDSPGKDLIQRHIENMQRNLSAPPASTRAGVSQRVDAPITSIRPERGVDGAVKCATEPLTEPTAQTGLTLLESSSVDEGENMERPGVTEEAALQELIACKMLLARVATELQEEKHFVSVLSAQNQKYAMRVSKHNMIDCYVDFKTRAF